MKERHTEKHPAQLTPIESRQGSPRRGNSRVLVISLILIVVAFSLIYAAFTNRAQLVPTVPTEQRQGN